MRKLLLAIVICLAWSAQAHAAGGTCPTGTPSAGTSNCYFADGVGPDTNTGTDEAHPWKYLPGMPNCASNCLTKQNGTISAGENFILKGGVHWHLQDNTKTPYTGGLWRWGWGGSGTNCSWPGHLDITTLTSCVYVGVDTAWYTGGSFSRPQFDQDNPTSTSFVASCLFDQSSSSPAVVMGGGSFGSISYVVFDNLEFFGHCQNSGLNPVNKYMNRTGTYLHILEMYMHGWTYTGAHGSNGGAAVDQATLIGGSGSAGATHNVVAYGVFDGTDSYCTGNNACSGGPVLYADAYDFDHNVCRRIAQCLNSPANTAFVHDNLFDNLYESFDPAAHSGVLENYGTTISLSSQPYYFYNNIIRHTVEGVTFNPNIQPNQSYYIFNNIFWDIANGGNCVSIGGSGSGSGMQVYITNNTFVSDTSVCAFRFTGAVTGAAGNFNGTATFQNNHIIGSGSSTIAGLVNTSGCALCSVTVVDNGNELFQTLAAANGQGYVTGNNYQPTTGASTIGTGANLSGQCATYSSDSALCNGSNGGVTNTAGSGTIPTLFISSPPARGSSWDKGAWQFSAGGSSCAVSPSPISLSFGNQQINVASGQQAITVTNTGSASCTTVSVAMQTGTDFAQTNNCPATLTASSTCTINVTFTPATVGVKADNAQIASNIATVNVAVGGTGISGSTGQIVAAPLGVTVIAH